MDKHTPIQLPLAIDGLTVEIPLTKGYVAVVDALDADLLERKWYGLEMHKGNVYAVRNAPYGTKPALILMHRVILERMTGRVLLRKETCDHQDMNCLNNRRSNLRLANHQQQSANKTIQCNNTSGLKGVEFNKRSQRWLSVIVVNKKRVYLGTFDDPQEAHEAYCKAAAEYFGEFARFE